jgi:NitT/TauT family transport system permease protein
MQEKNRKARSYLTRPISKGESALLSFLGFVFLLGTWMAAAKSGLISAKMLPSPYVVFDTMFRLFQEPFAGYTLQQHLLSSIYRYLLGLLLAAVIGIPLGLLMGWSRSIDRIVSPIFESLRFIAPIAWVPFATLWFGTGIGGPILIIFSGAFPPCVINAYQGARMIPLPLIEAAHTFGAGPWRMLVDVLAPGSLPSIVAGLRIAAGIGWQSLVGAELIVVSSGIGYLMVQGQTNYATNVVMAGMVAIGVTGFLIDVLLRFAQGKIQRGAAK